MLLADNGMGQEGIVLNRVMLEHTIVLHWIIARGDDGIDAMLANQSKQMRKWLDKTRDTTLEVPQEIAGEITASFDGIDETKAAGIFSDICRQVGCGDLYAVYGIWSQTVHPSLATSNAYVDPSSGVLRLAPGHDHSSNVSLVAHCLIWAQRALDRLLPDPARAQGLENLASAIQAIPVLPGYQPPAPPQPAVLPPEGAAAGAERAGPLHGLAASRPLPRRRHRQRPRLAHPVTVARRVPGHAGRNAAEMVLSAAPRDASDRIAKYPGSPVRGRVRPCSLYLPAAHHPGHVGGTQAAWTRHVPFIYLACTFGCRLR